MSATLTFDYDSPVGTGQRTLALAPAGPKGDTGATGATGATGPAGTSGVAPSGTGIVTVTSGTLGTPGALTGDVTTTAGGLATTLATVNGNVGTFTNASVTVNAKGLVTAASSGAAGGITIGDTVTSGTSGRVLYVGAGPVLAQDAGLTYDPATDTLTPGNLTLSAAAPSISQDGQSGPRIMFSSGNHYLYGNNGGAQESVAHVVGGRGIGLTSTRSFGWSPGAADAAFADTALIRAVNKVVGLTDGSTAGATLSSVPITPSQITSNQNNYAPGVARFYRLSTDASRDITGLSCSQVSGQECEIWNVDANNIVLKHQDANSTAANRFICTGAADITLAADEVCLLRYDSTTSRWRARKV